MARPEGFSNHIGGTMQKLMIAAVGLAFFASLAVHAQTSMTLQQPVVDHHESNALPDEVSEYHTHSFAGGALFRDTLGGAVLGAAAGGAYALYNKEQNNGGAWGNWQRPVLIGAAVGAGVGLVFGIVDATTWSDRAYAPTPVSDQDRHTTGFSPAAAQYGVHF
jgi:hypothetical protein